MYATYLKRSVVCFIIFFTVFCLCLCFYAPALAANDAQETISSEVGIESVVSPASSDSGGFAEPSVDVSYSDSSDAESSVSEPEGSDTSDIFSDTTSLPESDVSGVISDTTSGLTSDIVSDVSGLVSSDVSVDPSSAISSSEAASASSRYSGMDIHANSANFTPYQPIPVSSDSVVTSVSQSNQTTNATTSVKTTDTVKKSVYHYLKPIMWIAGILSLGMIALIVYFNLRMYQSKKLHPELYPKKDRSKAENSGPKH